ncbi:GGDEF domain-containing protein [Dyella sp. GSA-30]|nr:GGDEF domain-containing protein [Dyella sp. GSA-30]
MKSWAFDIRLPHKQTHHVALQRRPVADVKFPPEAPMKSASSALSESSLVMIKAMSDAAERERSLLDQALASDALTAHFQPVVHIETHAVVAHEGLIRSVLAGTALTPIDLLDLARARGRLADFELGAARCIVNQFAQTGVGGRLLINLSAHAILQAGVRPEDVIDALTVPGFDLSRVTIELTERDIVEDAAKLAHSLGYLRASGIRIALDDFGNGHSNFEMWNEIHPEVVKIDRYLINGLSRSAEKLAIVRALCTVAETLGADLVGEGVEDADDLRMLRELRIPYAQGFLIARPAPVPIVQVSRQYIDAVTDPDVVVPPSLSGPVTARPLKAEHLLIEAPAVSLAQNNDHVAAIFSLHERLHAIAVVDQGRPVGIINRRHFTERMAQPFARELFARKVCTAFMNDAPLLCDAEQSLQSMADILRGEDQRYLSDGFIITRGGMYLGLGTGESLVRRVTEIRVEAARYANPLTFLPGNIPVTEHLERLLQARRPFVTTYFDLDFFKPFNDHYGYFRGDEMIRLLASALTGDLRQDSDFVGHIGGDDFIVLFQSNDWEERCRQMRERFNTMAATLFDDVDRLRGGIEAEDRHGNLRFFPLTTVSVGAVAIVDDFPSEAESVASLAAQAKRTAKRQSDGFHVDRYRADMHVLAISEAPGGPIDIEP